MVICGHKRTQTVVFCGHKQWLFVCVCVTEKDCVLEQKTVGVIRRSHRVGWYNYVVCSYVQSRQLSTAQMPYGKMLERL